MQNYTHDMSGEGDYSRAAFDFTTAQYAASWRAYYAAVGNLDQERVLESDPVAIDIGAAQGLASKTLLRIVHNYGIRYATAARDYYSQFNGNQ